MNLKENIQIFLLLLGGCICFFSGVFSLIVEYKQAARKRGLLVIEFSTALLLFADAMMHIFRGNTTPIAYWMVRICSFLLFFLLYVEFMGFNVYVHSFNEKKGKRMTTWGVIVNVVALLGILFLVVSHFTGWVYYFDSANRYQRGPLFGVTYVAPLVILSVTFVLVLIYRKSMPLLVFASAIIFTVLTLVSSVFQAFFQGSVVFNLTLGISAITIFALSLLDQNMYLETIAYTDRMVGLPNSYGYLRELGKLCEKKEITKYDAFYFDVTNMGLLNRKYGSRVGDFVLLSFAKALRENHLESDEIMGRLGGNYFVAVTKKANTNMFLHALRGIDISLEPVGLPGSVHVSAVAGVYQIEDENCTPDQIMANVSMAVAIAKNVQHKPFVFLTEEVIEEMNAQRQLMEMIPDCLERKEFMPFYQPKVSLETGQLCGAEALSRWKHEGEFIPPVRFVPLLERNESICDFDFYMLRRVCEDIKAWRAEGRQVPVISVNFSRKNLGNPILAEEIYNVVKSYGIPVNSVQIEVTETLDDYPFDYLKGVVEALQRYGLTAAIDDFGVGSSSVRLIKDVPFDVLKIDKSFVDSLEEKDRKFLRHIIEMASETGASVIAEGVETKEQVDVLKELGCQQIQGYFFDKPLPKEEFEHRLENPAYM